MANKVHYEPPPVYPAGTYTARPNKFESKISREGNAYFRWYFVTRDRRGRPNTISDNSSVNFGPESKARAWVEALLGRRLTAEEAREGFDLDELIGIDCQIVVSVVQKGDAAYNRIDQVTRVMTDADADADEETDEEFG